jgi:hypothetical protein
MANNAEHLEAIFLKDHLAKTDVVDLLSGHRVRFAKGSGGSSVYNLVTGEKVDGSKAKDIIERWRLLKEIWESSTHGRSEIGLTFDPTAEGMMIPRNYVLWWTWSKWKPTSTIWKGFSACLKHGLEQEWTKPQDYVPQEETPEEVRARETEAKLNPLGQPREGKGKASDYDEKLKKQESEPSEREINNSLRIIGAMRDILTSRDGDVKEQKKNFTSDTQLINYLVANYDGEGLSPSTLKARFRDGASLTQRKKKLVG